MWGGTVSCARESTGDFGFSEGRMGKGRSLGDRRRKGKKFQLLTLAGEKEKGGCFRGKLARISLGSMIHQIQ